MYSRLQLAFKYLNYYLKASNGHGHGIHSPHVFQFITGVLNDDNNYSEYERVESLRRELLNDNSIIEAEDPGAGSASGSQKRTIASIARSSAKSAKYGQLLFRIARHYRAKSILELGTSLGLTTAYLSLARPEANLVTIEGAASIADRAAENFSKLNLGNINQVAGHFDDVLVPSLQRIGIIDLAFIDGNHRQEPTERYFRALLPFIKNDTFLIFDDIHWSGEMEAAWKTIRSNEKVRCSIDLFFIGIVLFREEFREKQHFTVRF